jgi:hypothetical protein
LELAACRIKPAAIAEAVNSIKPAEIQTILDPPRELEGIDLHFMIINGSIAARLITVGNMATVANLKNAASYTTVNVSRLAREMKFELDASE